MHLLGVLHITFANFAFLHEMDCALLPWSPYPDLLTTATACSFGTTLALAQAPVLVRAIAVTVVFAGYILRSFWKHVWIDCVTFEGVLHAIMFKYGDEKAVPVARKPPLFVLLGCRFVLQYLIQHGDACGCLKDQKVVVNIMLVFLLAYGCVNPFQKPGWNVNCYWAGYIGWVCALLTDQPWLYFYGAGYVASLCQGVSHYLSGEAANLPELALRTGPEKAADELAHTSLFPCLIVGSAYESLLATISGAPSVPSVGAAPEYARGSSRGDMDSPPNEGGVIVVTGCAGRIGRAVTEFLVEQGFRVRGFDRQPRPPSLLPGHIHGAFEYLRGDLLDSATLAKALRGCAAVCHFAAVPDDADFEKVLLPVNVLGLHRVLEACKACGVKRVVVASSGKIYFHRNDTYPIRVEDPPKPTCMYGATKLFLEGATEVFAKDPEACPTVVLRFAWCPFARPDVEAMESCSTPGQGCDEYMSPGDCSRCVLAALTADLGQRRYVKVFCQSKPPPGRPARFDMAPTRQILGFEPRDTHPTGIDWILNQTDYVKNPDLKKRVVPGATAPAAKRPKAG